MKDPTQLAAEAAKKVVRDICDYDDEDIYVLIEESTTIIKTAIDKATERERDLIARQDKHIEKLNIVINSRAAHASEPKRDGNWMDEMGVCKVCGGELPYGHTNACDIWKLEQQVSAAHASEQGADTKLLLDALIRAKEIIHLLHGDIAWEIYDEHSPEMKQINSAIDAAMPQRATTEKP